MEKDFSKYSKEELVGKLVLYEHGQSYNPHYSKLITTISKVTKTGFKINPTKNSSYIGEYIFDLNGRQKGLTGRSNMAAISECYLITEEEASNFRKEWKRKAEEKQLRETISQKIPNASFEQLQKICEILK